MLDKKVVRLGETNFTVTEIKMADMLPIMPRLTTDPEAAQLDMMKACVMVDGKPIGDDVLQLGVKSYMKLTKAVMDVNGLKEDEAGKE